MTLDSLVPKGHLLRKIDAVIDLSFVHDRVAGLYCSDTIGVWSRDELVWGMVSLKQPSTSSSGNSVFWRNATTMGSSAGVSAVLLGTSDPIGASVVVVRLRHLATVFGFKP